MNSEDEDNRDGTILRIPWQRQRLAQLQHGYRQQPNTEQRQQVDDTVLIPPDQQIAMPNNQQQQRRHQHQQLPSVGHIRPPRRAVFNPLRQREPMQIHQLAEIHVSITKMLHKHQHWCHYKIDVSLAKMLHKHQHCCHYKIYVSLAEFGYSI